MLLKMLDVFSLCVVIEQYVAFTDGSHVVPLYSAPQLRTRYAHLPAVMTSFVCLCKLKPFIKVVKGVWHVVRVRKARSAGRIAAGELRIV
jgi:hypothetical protein